MRLFVFSFKKKLRNLCLCVRVIIMIIRSYKCAVYVCFCSDSERECVMETLVRFFFAPTGRRGKSLPKILGSPRKWISKKEVLHGTMVWRMVQCYASERATGRLMKRLFLLEEATQYGECDFLGGWSNTSCGKKC
jgi:hypothetical protein